MKTVIKLAFVALFALGMASAQENQGFSSSKKSSPAPKEVASSDANAPAAAQSVPEPPVDEADVYRIGIEDDLQVSVWREPELSVQVTVRPDGMITMPLLNDIKVTGLTTKELQAQLIEKLKAYVTEPQVTVIVRGIKSRKVYLMGQVTHPGAVQLNSRKTVLQLLAEVGGLGPFAKDNMYVLRTENGQSKKIPFSYKKMLKGDMKDDIVLQPGDVIVAP
ncbi:MAG TPA: polysaccharide biosynthesis/export family protein [Terriglobales bacterium]|nr:polysaccharide biosynthesis/export family protein [Terriglobales bacterium]